MCSPGTSGSRAPPGTSGSRALPGTSGFCAPPGTSGFSGLTGSDPAGNPRILNLQTVASHQSCFLSVSGRFCTRCFLCTQLCNLGTENLSTPFGSKDQIFCNIRTFVTHVTFVTAQHSDSTLRRVFSNRQQWFAHRCLNTSNFEIQSPIVATRNLHSFATFDKFSSCCVESEITVTRNRRPIRNTPRPCRLSCTCVDSNLDPFRTSHLLRLLKCINIEVGHAEFINFNFWFNN